MSTLSIGCALAFALAAPALAGNRPAEWCRTLEAWQANGPAPEPVTAMCPIQGDCDQPAVRDAFTGFAGKTHTFIRVHLLVLREDDGSNPAATEAEVAAQMERMHDDFAAYGFDFRYTWQFVDDSAFRAFGDVLLMKALYAVDPLHQCNIFVTGGPNVGTFPWDTAALSDQGGIIVDENAFGGDMSVITHEMGHTLGLWHTHHGVGEVAPCSACWEEADGAFGDTTGDYCSDTPPTPRSDQCSEPGTADDCSGLKWGPTLPQDYMSYASGCWSLFTPQQTGRMHCWFESTLTSWQFTCLGDGNGDGQVGFSDFEGLLAAWGTDNAAYDLAPANGDGTVDIVDFVALLAAWGACP